MESTQLEQNIYNSIISNTKNNKNSLLYSENCDKFYYYNNDIKRWEDGYAKINELIIENEFGGIKINKKIKNNIIKKLKIFYNHPNLSFKIDNYIDIIVFNGITEVYSIKEKKFILPYDGLKISLRSIELMFDDNISSTLFYDFSKIYVLKNYDKFENYIDNIFKRNGSIIIFKNPPSFIKHTLRELLCDLYIELFNEFELEIEDNNIKNPFTKSVTKFYKLIWIDTIDKNIKYILSKMKKRNMNIIISINSDYKYEEYPFVEFDVINSPDLSFTDIKNYAVSILNKIK